MLTAQELQAAWDSPKGAKAAALFLGVSYAYLRRAWVDLFGEKACRERGKRIQALSAAEQARKMSVGRVFKDVAVSCSWCGKVGSLKANQTAHMDVATYRCEACKFGDVCPICAQPVAGQKGLASHFRHNPDSHPDYTVWVADQKWVGKSEPRDFVTCRECGLRAPALTGHLRTHGITAEDYRKKHGPEASLRSLGSAQIRNAAIKEARSSDAYLGTKLAPCVKCQAEHEIPRTSIPTLCSGCKAAEEELRWEDLTLPFDYVECVECGYRAENLTSHITNAHPNYRKNYPDVVIVALNSPIRDKSAIRGIPLSEETRKKMSEMAGRWNAGLTAFTDERVANMAQAIRQTYADGRVPWSKGLTKLESPILERASQTQKATRRAYLEANPTFRKEDFAPYLDSEGRVDRPLAQAGLGVSHPTVNFWVRYWGLHVRPKGEILSQRMTVNLSREDLLRFRIGTGQKISLHKACVGLKRSGRVVRREAQRHGLLLKRGRYKQGLYLSCLAEALGGLPYQEEWTHVGFRNPETDHRFRYDGYFAGIGLVTEFHGYQHYTFPNAFHKTESHHRAMRQRDAMKRGLVDRDPNLIYFMVREDEPFYDVNYLRGRLFQLGVLTPDGVLSLVGSDGITPPNFPPPDTLGLFGC